jgi:hypothetical protein
VSLADEVGELPKYLRLVRRDILLAAESAELEKLVIAVQPQYAESNHLVKWGWREALDRCVPDELGVRYGLDV